VTGDGLPPDLAAFEQGFRARARSEPATALRQRVLTAVRQELRKHQRRSAWQFAAALAAAALLWINFSMSVANNTRWPFTTGVDDDRLQATADRIKALAPELPETEVYRQAFLAQGASSPVPAPALPSSPDRILRYKDSQPWVTH
jgi:hypothetical protein